MIIFQFPLISKQDSRNMQKKNEVRNSIDPAADICIALTDETNSEVWSNYKVAVVDPGQ